MKYPFTYVVVYYYYDKDTKKNKYFREAGIGFAENYAEAAHILEDTFGEDIVRIINIFLMDGGDLLRLPEEYINVIENEIFEPIDCDANGRTITDKKQEKTRSNKFDSDQIPSENKTIADENRNFSISV